MANEKQASSLLVEGLLEYINEHQICSYRSIHADIDMILATLIAGKMIASQQMLGQTLYGMIKHQKETKP